MAGGRRLRAGTAGLQEARSVARAGIARLPERLRSIAPAEPPYPVTVSDRLERTLARLARSAGG